MPGLRSYRFVERWWSTSVSGGIVQILEGYSQEDGEEDEERRKA